MKRRDNVKCQCKAVECAAADSNCPVEFDTSLNEYNMLSKDGIHRFRLYFCWFCGGELPESRRPGLFTEPLAEEVAEMKQSLTQIHSAADAFARFGMPDAQYDVEASSAEAIAVSLIATIFLLECGKGRKPL